MLTNFKRFVGFKVLEYFLKYPTKKTYLKELAKNLDISPRSAKIYCDLFEQDGIINREIKGNIHLFSTNNDNFYVREMKRAYIALVLKEMDIEQVSQDAVSIALYGSYASGSNDEKSDLDILILGEEQNVKREKIIDIMKKIDIEIQLTVLPALKWEKMKKEHDSFAESILRNSLLIKGAEL